MIVMNYLKMLLLLVVLASCKQSTTNEHTDLAHAKTDTIIVVKKPASIPLQLKNRTHEILLEPYWQLQAALVESNAFGARKAALLLVEAAQHVKNMTAIEENAAAILLEADLEKQRYHFSLLSQELIKLVESAGIQEGAAYVAFCPMAMDDKGAYWLTPEKEIINPYFGVSMLNCGSIEKTIQ